MDAFVLDDDDDDLELLSSLECSKRKLSTKSATKRSASWIDPSFEGFDIPKASSVTKVKPARTASTSSKQRKRQRETTVESTWDKVISSDNSESKPSAITDQLWSDKYTPKTQSDLAVHKKKVQEVECWLRDSIAGRLKRTPFLLLTGPAGAGKTATVGVLASEMRLEIQEWINPIQEEYRQGNWTEENQFEFSVLGSVRSTSQSQLFRDFLLRSNKYSALNIFTDHEVQKKIILVEDFPNTFFREPSTFHEILHSYSRKGHCPLVFIVSDSQSSSESTEKVLFPKDLQARLGIANICFNPVAVTSITKTLTRIATQEAAGHSNQFTVPSKSTLEALANTSTGDIRGAINAIQFACLKVPIMNKPLAKKKVEAKLKTSTKLTSKQKGKSKATSLEDDHMSAIGARDTSLFLFRALGKILYCKRLDDKLDDHAQLPAHLSHCHRAPLQEIPEDVVEKSHMSGEFFTAFLHQNYLEFFLDIDDVMSASEYLSDADHLTTEWTSRSLLTHYAASVATRGLMFCNSARAKTSGTKSSGLGFKPLHKPEVFGVNRKMRDRMAAARQLFRAHAQTPEELKTQLLPYMSLINGRLTDMAQAACIQELTHFPQSKSASRWQERLDEKEVSEMDLEKEPDVGAVSTNGHSDTLASSQQGNMQLNTAEDNEEVIIEDFED